MISWGDCKTWHGISENISHTSIYQLLPFQGFDKEMAVMNWIRRWVYMGFTWAYVGLPHESDVHIFETGRLIYVISRVAAWGPWTLETLEAAIPELLLPNSWLLQRSRPSSACSSWNCAGTTLATDHERVEGMISVGKFIWSYWYILFLWAETNVKLCEVGNSKVSDSQKKSTISKWRIQFSAPVHVWCIHIHTE